jgi:hypothetical protein
MQRKWERPGKAVMVGARARVADLVEIKPF